MYCITVVSLLPELVEPVSQTGVVGRACNAGLLSLDIVSPRDFAFDQHRTVDDRPYGGGPGMVLKYEPVRDAIRAAGNGLLLVAGRYEGIDERIVQAEISEELSLGDFVLSGGELAAAVVIDAVARLIPGVLGHERSAQEDSYMTGLLGHPQYTRPETIDELKVPEVLVDGHHEAIRLWRLKQALGRTWLRRPELLESRGVSVEEKMLLEEFIEEQDN
jgi:tRNA (guanine37-N1)-methyltransferase